MFYSSKPFGYERDIWVRALRCRGTYRLIRTTVTGIAFACLFGLGAGTVL
jgi:hypothetical protein